MMWSNLFPVKELPDQVYCANTNYRYAQDIYHKIVDAFKDRQDMAVPPFL